MVRAVHSRWFSRGWLLLVAVVAVLSVWPPPAAGADLGCKQDSKVCLLDRGCCSGVCFKKAKTLLGTCCRPTTCAAQGTNCGSVPDGCGRTLNCGTCTEPDTCGGGGTPNSCGCARRTCDDVGASCGTISDGCGGTLDCEVTRGCSLQSDCSDTQTCFREHFLFGATCQPKLSRGRLCSQDVDCQSDCCCGELFPDPLSGIRQRCSSIQSCPAGQRYHCPGAPCGQDSDCEGEFTQFCTGGICRSKQEVGTQCVFSSACDGTLRNPSVPVTCCCVSSGASSGECTAQTACFDSGGACECGDPTIFNDDGICPFSPCGSDDDCDQIGQFCTGGLCRPKQFDGGSCLFDSACWSGCCCATPGSPTPRCADNQSACTVGGGTCNP